MPGLRVAVRDRSSVPSTPPRAGRRRSVVATIAVLASVLAGLASRVTFAAGTPPAIGDVIFNEYAADDIGSGDFFELLVLRDHVDLRGVRVSDNELTGGGTTLNNNESVLVFGNNTYLSDVPKGTLIAVWTNANGVVTDTVVNPSAGDWKMVLAPGTGVTLTTDGLGGSTNAGLSASGEALYLYLPCGTPPDPGGGYPTCDSAGTDNVYLDFISWEADGATAPPGLVDLNLSAEADDAYYTGNTAAGKDLSVNWVKSATLGAETPGEPNPGQDLSGLRTVPLQTDLTITLSDAPDPIVVGSTLTYTLQVGVAGVDATGVTVQLTLPASGATYSGATVTNGFTASQAAGVVTFSGGSITAGSSATLTVDVVTTTVGPLASGSAVADPGNTITEGNEDNNTAAPVMTIVQSAANTLPSISAIPALSGAIGDPTNPGVSFTVGDAETAAGALVVTATATSNPAVAPVANISVSGAGASRTVTVNPAGVGYADITVTVTDGGLLQASTVLRYAASAASVTPATSRFHTGAADASTAVAVDADYMLVGDDENQGLRLYARHASGLPLKTFDFTSSLGLTDLSGGAPREVDIEASARIGNRIYWMGSHDNGSDGQIRVNRYRLFATDLSNPGPNADLTYVGRYDHLRADLIAWDSGNGHGLGAGYYAFALGTAAGTPPEAPNATGFNIEGLTIAPDGITAYLAFRAPLVPISHRASALIVPLTNVDSLLAGDGGVAGSAHFSAPIELNLGGRGIRSIDRNSAGEYLIVAGPYDDTAGAAPKDFRLFTWTGMPADTPVLRAADLTVLAARGGFEGIVDVPSPLSSTSPIQLVVDNGDAVFYGDGTSAKDLAEKNFQKSRSDVILLGDAVPGEAPPLAGSIPVPGDIIFNEYASDNDASGNDFFELLVLRDNLDLRGLRVSDNEVNGSGVLNNNESVFVFGQDAFLKNVPQGTLIAVYTLVAGVTTDTVVNPAANDWKMVLAPGTGVTASIDGLGGSLGLGLATGGDALYLYLPGPDGTSAGSDNVYLDFISWEGGASGPPGLVSLDLPSLADNAYYTGHTAAGNDLAANWVRYDGAPVVGTTTAGDPNPGQDLSSLRNGSSSPHVTVTESGGSTTVTEGGGSDSYTIQLSAIPLGPVQIRATGGSQIELSADNILFASTATVVLNGASPVTIRVRAIDDAIVEGPMMVSITHGIVASGDPAYSDALTPVPTVTVSVTDNDVLLAPIAAIQGPGSVSPLVGTVVNTRGIVTALRSNGFYIQEPDETADGDPRTSEGVFVFTSSTPTVTTGDLVQVSATVSEFVPAADLHQPPVTELTGPAVAILSSGNSLPAAIEITAAMTTAANAVQLLESLEGMRVRVPSLTVVGPTLVGSSNEAAATSTTSGVFYGVVSGVARPFREPGIDVNDPLPPGSPCCIPRFDGNPERLRIDSDAQPGTLPLDLTAGVTVTGMVGPLDYSFRTYTVLPDPGSATVTTPNAVFTPAAVAGSDEIVVAGFNMERFFDTVNDPAVDDVALTAAAFENRLRKASLTFRNVLRLPDVVGVVEMENLSTLQTIASRVNADVVAAGGVSPGYTAYLVEGNDIGGIDVGFLVKSGRVTVLNVRQEGKTTTFVDPTDNSVDLLNDRPPLVLDARVIRPNGSVFDFTVVVNHLRSLSGVDDDADGPRVRAKRRAQAEYLAALIQSLQTATPSARVMAIGDFNAFDVSDGYVDSIGTIRGAPASTTEVALASPDLVTPNLTNLVSWLPAAERYSYVFDGNAQVLDHALVNVALLPWVSRFGYTRSNADFPDTARNDATRPERLSDHDASVTYLAIGTPKLSGRLVGQTPRLGSGQMTVTLQIANLGGGNARGVVIDQVLLKTLTGTGTVTLATPVPIAAGDIAAGQSINVTLTLNVPASVVRFSVTGNGAYADSGATGYRFSLGLPVAP